MCRSECLYWFLIIGILQAGFFHAEATNKNSSTSPALYWISYTEPVRGFPKVLIQIDGLGNILRGPTRVIRPSNFGGTGSCATAIAKNGAEKLNLWFPGKAAKVDDPAPIYRAVINKNNLELLSVRQTKLQTSNTCEPLQATQRRDNNFLTFQVEGDVSSGAGKLAAFGLRPNGLFDGESWQLFVEQTRSGGISADGKMAFVCLKSSTSNQLVLQPLGARGRPRGNAQLITGRGGAYIDITRPLSGERRFLVFLFSREYTVARLVLQVVNAKTGEKIGNKIVLYTDETSDVSGSAIDPSGGFVIFSIRDSLVFQALDSTGHPSGNLKVLVPHRGRDNIGGVNILKE